MFPEHKCGLYVTHNEHRDYYESIEAYIKDRDVEFESEDEKAKSIATDSLWSIQWYPRTPVGFCIVYASTFEEALRLANESE